MRMKLATALVAAAAVLVTVAANAGAATYTNLKPGQRQAELRETVPVNVVFVGFEPGDVSEAAFRAQLPNASGGGPDYRAIVRSRLWYGKKEYLGLDYDYDYNVVYADSTVENAFFGYLSSIKRKQKDADGRDRTLFQQQYNDQVTNVRNVGTNYFIDAPSVEKWLIDNKAGFGVDTSRDTVFFVNWWGRSNFVDHVYTKTDEPDPDTGYNFGVNRQSRKIMAWGGTTPDDEESGLGASRGVNRIWFYDLSAGPESWGGNWNVDDADVDGDGVADYRLPPAWEYGAVNGYAARRGQTLAADLGKVARYAAINLLFTSSPLYPPYIDAMQPETINLDLNTYEGWNGVDVSSRFQKPGLLRDEVSEVHRVNYNVDSQDIPFTGAAQSCYLQWIASVNCYQAYRQYDPFANLFLWNGLNQNLWRDNLSPRDYDGAFFNYAVNQPVKAAPFLGFADDNWYDGTQSATFNFISPDIVSLGYGLTTTQIHEYGHHFGMSHPHDGYDYLDDADYGGEGSKYFVWTADEVNSIMSYIDLNWDYSQFDRDNANRHQAAAYYINANVIAGKLLERDPAANLSTADALLGQAKTALAAHDYVTTFDKTRAAYQDLRAKALASGVTVSVATSNGWTILPAVKPGNGKTVRKKQYAYVDKVGAGSKRGGS